jgi:hypothetical protein
MISLVLNEKWRKEGRTDRDVLGRPSEPFDSARHACYYSKHGLQPSWQVGLHSARYVLHLGRVRRVERIQKDTGIQEQEETEYWEWIGAFVTAAAEVGTGRC